MTFVQVEDELKRTFNKAIQAGKTELILTSKDLFE